MLLATLVIETPGQALVSVLRERGRNGFAKRAGAPGPFRFGGTVLCFGEARGSKAGCAFAISGCDAGRNVLGVKHSIRDQAEIFRDLLKTFTGSAQQRHRLTRRLRLSSLSNKPIRRAIYYSWLTTDRRNERSIVDCEEPVPAGDGVAAIEIYAKTA